MHMQRKTTYSCHIYNVHQTLKDLKFIVSLHLTHTVYI